MRHDRQGTARRRLPAVVVGIMLVASLLVPGAPAGAAHGTFEDCSRPSDPHSSPPFVCLPDGNGSATLYNPYTRNTCRYDGTVSWGDGASETVPNWQDTQSVYHQYTAHGQFTLVIDLEGTPLQEGVSCDLQGSTSIVEVPTPRDATPPEEQGRVASSAFPLRYRIEQAKRELRPLLDELIARHQELEEQLAMHRRGLRNRIQRHEERLDELEAVQRLFSRLSAQVADGIGRADGEAMNHHRRILREARIEELAARQLMQNAERDVRDLLLRRDEVGRRLLGLAEAYEALDFELLGMVVAADGDPVYAVDLTSPYGRLLRLDRQIRSLRSSAEELLVSRREALGDFERAHQAASAQLADIADLIWRNAQINASVDFATSACDVGIAAAKGGWAGVLAEVSSKVFEAGIKMAVAEPVGDPNPGKDAVESWFRSTTTDAVGESARTIGIERGIKETAGKAAKDWVANALKERWPRLAPANPPAGTPPAAVANAAQRSTQMQNRIKSIATRLRTETFRAGFREWFQSSVGRKLVVDAGKSLLKRRLNNAEMAAWRDYIMLDIQAQGLFSLWQAAANAYWDTVDQLEALQLEKDEILREFDPGSGQSIKLQESFPLPAMLTVRLLVPRSSGAFGDVPIRVFVSGVQTRRTAPREFQIATGALPPAELGRLTVSVR